jgi:hypothetical protein
MGLHRGKEKDRTSLELCGLVFGAETGTTIWLETRMDIRFFQIKIEKYRQKYRH